MYDVLAVLGFIFGVFALAISIANRITIKDYTEMVKMKVFSQCEREKTTTIQTDSQRSGSRSIPQSSTSSDTDAATRRPTEVEDLPISTIAPNLANPPISKGGFGSKSASEEEDKA